MTLNLDKLIADEDISYEESISKDPTNISTWISYYNFKSMPLPPPVYIINYSFYIVVLNQTLHQLNYGNY